MWFLDQLHYDIVLVQETKLGKPASTLLLDGSMLASQKHAELW